MSPPHNSNQRFKKDLPIVFLVTNFLRLASGKSGSQRDWDRGLIGAANESSAKPRLLCGPNLPRFSGVPNKSMH